MAQRWGVSSKLVGLLLFPLLVGCHTTAPSARPVPLSWNTVPSSLLVPLDVERLAVLYPKTYSRELMEAYTRLEGATFQLKAQRPSLRIVERFNLPSILGEQRLQMGGAVSDETAIRIGRLLGVDSVLIYRIEGPTLRDRLFARYHGDLPPFMVTSKIVRVESAEVVFHNVVITRMAEPTDGASLSLTESDMQPLIRAALEHGVAQTVADLWNAFR